MKELQIEAEDEGRRKSFRWFIAYMILQKYWVTQMSPTKFKNSLLKYVQLYMLLNLSTFCYVSKINFFFLLFL